MDFIGLSVVIQLIVDYINYNIMERADTINSVQFDTDKQDYDVNSVSYDSYVSVCNKTVCDGFYSNQST